MYEYNASDNAPGTLGVGNTQDQDAGSGYITVSSLISHDPLLNCISSHSRASGHKPMGNSSQSVRLYFLFLLSLFHRGVRGSACE